jgi:hypothetical protein
VYEHQTRIQHFECTLEVFDGRQNLSTIPFVLRQAILKTSLIVIITIMLRNSLTKSLSLKRLVAAASPATAASNKMRLLSTTANTTGFPTPILFDYEMIKKNLTVADAIPSVEEAFGALANGKVDVPMPMHIGIEESEVAGPGDCHIKVRRIRQIRHPVHGKVL